MSDKIVPPPQEPDAPEDKPGLTSLEFDALQDALHTLYIPGNQSGRIHFTQSWPQIANYLFDAQLIHYDTHGATDKAHRDQLELEAIQRLDDLIVSIEDIEEKSAKSGVLQVEFVQPLVNKLGRDLALLVYNEEIVNRFAPETVQTATPAPTETQTSAEHPAPAEPIDEQEHTPAEEQVIEPVQTLEPETPPAMEPPPTEPLQEAPIEASPVEPPLVEPIDEAPAPPPGAIHAKPIQQEAAPIETEPQPIAEPVQQPQAEEPTQEPEAKIFASTTVSQKTEPLSELKAQLIAKKIELESKAQSEEN